MKKVTIGIVFTVMIGLAGCSSKSAVSTNSTPGNSSSDTIAGASPAKAFDSSAELPVVRDTGLVAVTDNSFVDQGSVQLKAPDVALPQSPVPSAKEDAVVAGPVIGDIFFDFNSAALNSDAENQLKQNAAWMQKHAMTAVTIEGHCDERGTDEYNVALGERRAISAMDYLVTLGIGSQRFTIVSYGEEQPFDQGHNEESWSMNRRAHFITK